jgi:hypothetical protein
VVVGLKHHVTLGDRFWQRFYRGRKKYQIYDSVLGYQPTSTLTVLRHTKECIARVVNIGFNPNEITRITASAKSSKKTISKWIWRTLKPHSKAEQDNVESIPVFEKAVQMSRLIQ